MVALEFQLDQAALAAARRTDLTRVSEAVLEETYFEMPVRFKVGDVELLEMPMMGQERIWVNEPGGDFLRPAERDRIPSPWRPLPLLLLAAVGLEKVREASQQGSSICSLPSGGDLRFEVTGNDAVVHSALNGRTGHARYDKLLRTFEDFAARVREALNREVPELRNHPYWGEWLKETA